MATQEIDRATWPAFFDDFSKQYEGSLASIETVGVDIGDQQGQNLPFQGISFDRKGSEAGAVIIMLGTELDNHLERIIVSPKSVQHKLAGEAGPAVLEIKSEDEGTVLLHLEPAMALPAP